MPVELMTSADLEGLSERLSAMEQAQSPTGLAAAVQKESAGWLCKVVGVNPSYKSVPVGDLWNQIVWGAIDYDLFPVFVGDVRCAVRAGPGGPPSGNFVLNRSGIYEFRAQIYLEPPAHPDASLSVYLGLFDLGVDGNGATLVHVANQNIISGMHPAVKFEAPVKSLIPEGQQRYFAFRWYFLDGGGVTPAANLQTAGTYCWADVTRKCLLT